MPPEQDRVKKAQQIQRHLQDINNRYQLNDKKLRESRIIYRIFRGISMLFTAPSERESPPQLTAREPSVPTSSRIPASEHISDDSLQNSEVPYNQGQKKRHDLGDNSPQFPRRETTYKDERPAEVRFNRMQFQGWALVPVASCWRHLMTGLAFRLLYLLTTFGAWRLVLGCVI